MKIQKTFIGIPEVVLEELNAYLQGQQIAPGSIHNFQVLSMHTAPGMNPFVVVLSLQHHPQNPQATLRCKAFHTYCNNVEGFDKRVATLNAESGEIWREAASYAYIGVGEGYFYQVVIKSPK